MSKADRRTQRKATCYSSEEARERHRLRQKARYAADPDYYRRASTKSRKKDPEAHRARNRKYRAERKFTALGRMQELISMLRRRAKEKKLDFDLDVLWALERIEKNADRCEVTQIPFVYDNVPRNPWQPSVDRIDSTKGYTQDNCRVVLLMYNNAKNDNSDEDVARFAREFVANIR